MTIRAPRPNDDIDTHLSKYSLGGDDGCFHKSFRQNVDSEFFPAFRRSPERPFTLPIYPRSLPPFCSDSLRGLASVSPKKL